MDLIKIAAPVISHPATVYTIVLLLFVWAFLSGIILWQRSTQFGSFVEQGAITNRRVSRCTDIRCEFRGDPVRPGKRARHRAALARLLRLAYRHGTPGAPGLGNIAGGDMV